MPILNMENMPSSISQLMQMLMLKKMMGRGQGGFPSGMSNFARQNATQGAAGMAQAATPQLGLAPMNPSPGAMGQIPPDAIQAIMAMLQGRGM